MLLEPGHLGGYVAPNEPRSIYESATVANEGNNNNHSNNNNIEVTRGNIDENGFAVNRGTPIQNFYAGQSVFVTGGTGFLGKILTEKLLRSCPEISTIYLLVRGKKAKSIEERIEDLFNDSVYDLLREEQPKFRHKVVAVSGDCESVGLGLSSTDRERLERDVSIVFHSAATVRFNERINIALSINVRATAEIIALCKHMPKLKAFIHVSTAYANCFLPRIEESFYPHPAKYDDLDVMLGKLQDQEIDQITPTILGEWPNTYTFTKALAEDVVREKCAGLNVGIFRPGIVTSSVAEPVPGWIDNFYGPTGTVAAVASGILRTANVDPSLSANVVPVDLTVNALIASAWDVANQPERRNENMLIYNYVSTVDAPISWIDYCSTNMMYTEEFPLMQKQWKISLRLQKYKILNDIGKVFLHYLPALIIDFFCMCLGKKPFLMQMYQKLHKIIEPVVWFSTHEWAFTNDNVNRMWERLNEKDRHIFKFSMKNFDWNSYCKNYMKGVKLYLLKEDLSTLEASRARSRRLNLIHNTLMATASLFLLWLLWRTVVSIFIF